MMMFAVSLHFSLLGAVISPCIVSSIFAFLLSLHGISGELSSLELVVRDVSNKFPVKMEP